MQVLPETWIEVAWARRTGKVLTWPAKGIEEHPDGDGKSLLHLVVMKDGVKGLIPLPEAGVGAEDGELGPREARNRLRYLVGQPVDFVVTWCHEDTLTFRASRKKALEVKARDAWLRLRPGERVEALVRRPAFRKEDRRVAGFVVEVDGVEGFLPRGELSWGWVDDPLKLLRPGDRVVVEVLEADRERGRLVVSRKAVLSWEEQVKNYREDGRYAGVVTRVTPRHLVVELEPGVTVTARHMKVGIPGVGDLIEVVITGIDPERKRLLGIAVRPVK
ncbi:RNA binding S1 domain protein [Ammonifex degensii KC4]|uniref:RNA binding S1 domain protein n=1 Tax=Ammonifex degensii (strain DSM 10501 / KC4) TaxID=429009 RepID=C9RC54_AMMDK|nr:S1 RNA-binding domain-containing protein [Ammonifex degensii]ACX51831.1 RNA binding S1 domain protein [Ammonifex degensii KC4]